MLDPAIDLLLTLQSGQPLPPVSPALHLLQLQRTGLLVQHMI
jgi:hypothetical protein